MKAEDLRIGNYYDNNGRIEKVNPNTIIDVWESERTWCKPIKLTEEWIFKLGGKPVIGNEFTIGFITVEFDNQGCYYTAGEGLWLSKNIEYVHELQNLHHALSGKELTLINN